ncbi:hypothetical protein HAZT_HAZT005424 [Hyalella azteca]|uniref:Prostaglandin-endoperoxide synthase n=1 Tax=Hyalella azteca TaxID=294128 RepID=A0A6A0H721_HYAAZ|nr:hypothetical protein HAZT_HAZT005424 [Hyalella azteca]
MYCLATWIGWVRKGLQPDPATLHAWLTQDLWVWRVVNAVPFLSDYAMKYIYLSRSDLIDSPVRFESDHSYTTLDAYFNETYYARTLPPTPRHCPTPMGVVGPKEYPDVDEVIQKVFLRKTFIPGPFKTNLLFQYYAQHFTHQFFRTNYTKGPQFTKGNGGVDASNIYGLTESHRRHIRLFKDGKLKYREVNGEHFPPLLKDVEGLDMEYPPGLPIPEESKHALGHPFYALLPGLFAYSTIWLREHNRVCDVLKEEHPHWDDERLYHTAKLIITGEIIKITVENYVQHLSQYKVNVKFRPHVVHNTRFQFHNRINVEFDHLYHWHQLVPDGITINDTYYDLMDMAFSVKPIFTHGLDTFIQALNSNRAGKMGPHNHGVVNVPVLKRMLLNSRALRFQGINSYRKRFKMSPFKSFEELTGDQELADVLRLFTEHDGPSVMSLTVVNMGGPWSVKGLIANPICSPQYWKPSTFGGEKGFEIVNTASLEKLFCRNMKSKCQNIDFVVPDSSL